MYLAQGWALGSLGVADRMGEKAVEAEREAGVAEKEAVEARVYQLEAQRMAGDDAVGNQSRALVEMAGSFQAAGLAQRAAENSELLKAIAALERKQQTQLETSAELILSATSQCIRFLDANPLAPHGCPDLQQASLCYYKLAEAIAVATALHPKAQPPLPPQWDALCGSWGCEQRACWCAEVGSRFPGFCTFFTVGVWAVVIGFVGFVVFVIHSAKSSQREMV